MASERAPFLAIDLGATNVRAAVGDRTGTIRSRARRKTPQGPDGDAVTAAVLDCARTACRDDATAPDSIVSAGIGSIGPLDRDAGAVDSPPNVPVDRIELVEPVREAFGLDHVVLHNDAVAGAIGERRWADAPDHFVYLTLSTGIGAGVVVDGNVLSGYRGNVAEVGHVTVDPEGRLTCGCGAAGHWEAYCSGSAIPKLAAMLASVSEDRTELPVVSARTADAETVPEQQFEAADVFASAPGDPLAKRTLTEFGRRNALGVAATIHAFAPRTVRIGGAVALENRRAVLAPIRERLPAHLAVETPDIDIAALGSDAVLLGALAAAIDAV